jgi:hypothetical protein
VSLDQHRTAPTRPKDLASTTPLRSPFLQDRNISALTSLSPASKKKNHKFHDNKHMPWALTTFHHPRKNMTFNRGARTPSLQGGVKSGVTPDQENDRVMYRQDDYRTTSTFITIERQGKTVKEM